VVNAVRSEFEDDIAFVRANLQTPEGQAFASKHGVSNTTLVFLDANGDRIAVLRGEQDRAALREQILSHFEISR